MRRRIELDAATAVQFLESNIKKIECYPDKIEFQLFRKEKSDAYSILLSSSDHEEKVDYSSNLIIELMNDWDVICEDWDEGSDEAFTEKRENTNPINRKKDHRLGVDISLEFCKEIDLEIARIESIQFSDSIPEKYELILKAPYIETNENNDIIIYYSGPFKIYSSRINLLID